VSDLKTVTVKEAAERLGVRAEWVRKRIKQKELKASNIGSIARPMYRIRLAVLNAFLESRTVEGIEED